MPAFHSECTDFWAHFPAFSPSAWTCSQPWLELPERQWVSLKAWSMKTITIAYSWAFWYYCIARMLSGPPPEIITTPWAQFGGHWKLLTHDCSHSSPSAWSQPSFPSNPPHLSFLFSHWHWMSKFSKSPWVKKLGASISHPYDKDDEAAAQGGAFTRPHCSTPTAEQRMDNVWKPKRNPGMPQRKMPSTLIL